MTVGIHDADGVVRVATIAADPPQYRLQIRCGRVGILGVASMIWPGIRPAVDNTRRWRSLKLVFQRGILAGNGLLILAVDGLLLLLHLPLYKIQLPSAHQHTG